MFVVVVSVKPQVLSQPPMLFGKKASDLKPESKPVALTDDHKATQKATKDGKQLELDKEFMNGKWTIEQGETIELMQIPNYCRGIWNTYKSS